MPTLLMYACKAGKMPTLLIYSELLLTITVKDGLVK